MAVYNMLLKQNCLVLDQKVGMWHPYVICDYRLKITFTADHHNLCYIDQL